MQRCKTQHLSGKICSTICLRLDCYTYLNNREKTSRRAAAAAKKFTFDSDDSDKDGSDKDDADDFVVSDSDEEFAFQKPKAPAAKKKATKPVFGSSDDDGPKKPKMNPAPLNVSSDDMFEALMRSTPKKDEPEKNDDDATSSPSVINLGKPSFQLTVPEDCFAQ